MVVVEELDYGYDRQRHVPVVRDSEQLTVHRIPCNTQPLAEPHIMFYFGLLIVTMINI